MKRNRVIYCLILTMIMTALNACIKPEAAAAPKGQEKIDPKKQETLSPEEVKSLEAAHPDAFGLDASKGLKVLAFGDNEGYFRFRLISGELDCYPAEVYVPASKYKALTAEEVRKMVLFYGLPDEKVTLHPWQDPLSSYFMRIDDALLQDLREAFDNRFELGQEIKWAPGS
jgi:hypothetical protein